MKNEDRLPNTADDLIGALESAQKGSRTLDVQLAFKLGEAGGSMEDFPATTRLPAKWHALGDFPAIAKIMLDEGFSWQSVCDVLDCEAPAYTTSLDAGIPGENIVFVIRSAKRNQWGAIHKTADGEEIFGWGATEVLARRTAALKGWERATAAMPEMTQPDASSQNGLHHDVRTESAGRRKSVINGEHHAVRTEKSLEEAFAEQEDRDWEILF
ncbi:hypothetical protein [Rhodospirillaceae bacterium SYSU D60014]|uniref:hypothetical protein n=1 Tax=Virgifigura deserti TaxID=2268457 RepID=UPI000E66C116